MDYPEFKPRAWQVLLPSLFSQDPCCLLCPALGSLDEWRLGFLGWGLTASAYLWLLKLLSLLGAAGEMLDPQNSVYWCM